ncbi:MAG TPA: DNA polymerase III subunit delta [Candidatus Saccharimonadales bacterium]
MILTLTGENSFGLQAALQRIIMPFVVEHGDLALERIDGQEADFARIRESLASLPFLAARKMVVLRGAGANKQFAEKFEQVFNEIPETTDLILVEPKLDKRLSYYKFLKKHTDFREFPELDPGGLAHWLGETAKAGGGSLSAGDARYLVERVGANQQLLSNELEKLLLYDSNITRGTIDLLTEPTPQGTIFQLLEAAFAGRTKTALELYDEQRAQKVETPQIIAMLAWQLHVLAIVKTAGDRSADDIARDSRINPFVVRKSQSIARQLTMMKLKALVASLLTIDQKTKRTNIDPDEALKHYLLSISL